MYVLSAEVRMSLGIPELLGELNAPNISNNIKQTQNMLETP